MKGSSGYGRHGRKYHYYVCSCEAKPLKARDVESLVVGEVIELLNDDEMFDYIVDVIWDYYIKEDKLSAEQKRLDIELAELTTKEANIIKSIEEGLPYSLVKSRLDQISMEKETIARLAAENRLKQSIRLSKNDIISFMKRFRQTKCEDRDATVAMVKVFINSVFYADNELTLVLNYSEEQMHISLSDIQKASTIEPNMIRPCLQNQGVANGMRTVVYGNALVISKKILGME